MTSPLEVPNTKTCQGSVKFNIPNWVEIDVAWVDENLLIAVHKRMVHEIVKYKRDTGHEAEIIFINRWLFHFLQANIVSFRNQLFGCSTSEPLSVSGVPIHVGYIPLYYTPKGFDFYVGSFKELNDAISRSYYTSNLPLEKCTLATVIKPSEPSNPKLSVNFLPVEAMTVEVPNWVLRLYISEMIAGRIERNLAIINRLITEVPSWMVEEGLPDYRLKLRLELQGHLYD